MLYGVAVAGSAHTRSGQHIILQGISRLVGTINNLVLNYQLDHLDSGLDNF